MTFNQSQIDSLAGPLSKAHVKKNPKGFDYVEAWHAIDMANQIFGFDAWDRETIDMVQLGEPELTGVTWRVAYRCRVRITVRADGVTVRREGTGYGSGIVKDIRDAHESAVKEAESDAMKRALMTFGNPFGLALYDKTKANVEAAPPPAKASNVTPLRAAEMELDVLPNNESFALLQEMSAALAKCESKDGLVAWAGIFGPQKPLLIQEDRDEIARLFAGRQLAIKLNRNVMAG